MCRSTYQRMSSLTSEYIFRSACSELHIKGKCPAGFNMYSLSRCPFTFLCASLIKLHPFCFVVFFCFFSEHLLLRSPSPSRVLSAADPCGNRCSEMKRSRAVCRDNAGGEREARDEGHSREVQGSSPLCREPGEVITGEVTGRLVPAHALHRDQRKNRDRR